MKHRILVVDDNPITLKFLKATYEPEGYDVVTASDGLEALEILLQKKIDLVISDILMPNIDGYLLCYKIRTTKKLNELPIIVYTATYVSTKEEQSAREMGANLFLRKPTPVKLLLSSVDDILRHPEKYPAVIPTSRKASASMQNYNEELVTRIEQNNIDLKETKQKIEQSEARLKQAQAISHVGSWELDFKTGIGVWSEETCRIYGLSLDDNKHSYEVWQSFIHPDDLEEVIAANSEAQKILGSTFINHRIILRDGTIKHLHSESKFEIDNTGQPLGMYGICQDITEQKISEQARDFDQKNLFALINNTNDLIWSVDRDLTLISSNHPFDVAVKTMLGRNIEKRINVLSLGFGNDELSRWKQFYARALSGETFTEIEYNNLPFESWREISFYPIRKGDVVIGTACYAHDITEQKKNEQAIKNSEEIRRLIVNSALDAIVGMNTRGEVMLWNPQAEKIFGWTEKEILGKKMSETIIPEHLREMHRDRLKNYNLTGKGPFFSKRSEITALTKDRREIPIELTIVPIKQGDSEFFCSFIKDISESREAAEKLVLNEKRFQALIENISDGIVLNDENSKLLYQSPSVTRILGYTWEERKDKHVLSYVHPDNRDEFIDLYKRIKATPGEPISFQYRFLHQEGRYVWLEGVVTNMLNDPSVNAIVANYRDITERKNAEHEILKLNSELEERVTRRTEQLQAANKEMEAFTYSVSHDLRAPLRIIDGYGQMLIEDYAAKLDEEANETLKVIMSNAKKMGQLIDDLLNLSRMNKAEIRKSKVDMTGLVNDVLFELQQSGVLIPKKLQILKLKEANCDANLVRHVWSNLLSNAIKYSSAKELPEVEVGMHIADNKRAVYYVRDNGAGFDMKYYHKLFGVFQRLHNHDEFSGTGVGLAIVHRIISRHGGTIWGEARPNEGATFFFSFD